ncbi:MAG: YdbH domain-containing protein [Kiritimatiellia bacterium]
MKARRAFRVVLFLLAALLLAAAAAWRNLPFIVSRWVLPRLETSLEARIRTDVVRCDASGLMLRNLSFHSALFRFNADEIVAAWRLSDLRRGTINHLRVQGGRLEFSVPFPPSPTPLILTPSPSASWRWSTPRSPSPCRQAAHEARPRRPQRPGRYHHLRDVDAPADGFVTLDALLLDGVRLASASGTLRAGNSSIRVQGRFDADAGLARAAHADVQGTVDFPSPSDPKLDFAFTAPAFPLDPAAPALAHFLGAPLPVAASATAAVSGRLTGSGQHPVLPVKLVLSEGRIDGGEGKFAATGVRAALESADLFALESAPAQELTVETLTAGAMAFSKLRMLFRVEPAGVLFVEEGAVSWCGGWLRLYAMRLRSEHDLGLTVYCDQLKLDELLKQIGFADINTNASLSGRLPVRLQDGRMMIRGGELFSHPGAQGELKIGGADILAASLDPGSPAHGNVLFTQAALKHFLFDWILMKIDTEGDQVRIGISMFGKPAEALPFRYDSKAGSFVRLQVKGEQGISNPVGLTMNVNLPMRGIVYDRNGLKALLKDLK